MKGARYRPPSTHGRPVDLPGHFAGLVRLGRETLALTTDSVGTKVLLAQQVGRWEEVGEDIVGVNVNDLAAVGARPVALVDTILCDEPRPEVFRAIGRGLGRGLRRAPCALLGGETAVVPDMVHGIDLGATALGFFPGGRLPVSGTAIRAGDVVVGIPSNGLHANGFTLVRRLIDASRVDLRAPRPGGRVPIGTELLAPTRIYTRAVDAIADDPGVRGLAHLSGGGVRNLVRLRPDVSFVLDHWPSVPGVFRWLQSLGSMSETEMFQTFNMGVGFAIVVRPTRLASVQRGLVRAGVRDAVPIGHVARGRGVVVPEFSLRYDGYS
ncbi:MAG: phosphoribosylformylglycinamidine cyclo-ligase [Thermoplasmata archaeon]|nr:phosphoribosylformylglycinamidine cyclo-ligase [Thermoplasmata archaeon]